MIKINASSQRRQKFYAAQLGRKRPINLVQDVSTRWNSTLKMLRRARKLAPAIDQFRSRCPEEKIQAITPTEWKHIDYLIEILYPFNKYTDAIGKSVNTPTSHQVFAVYNEIFDHLEDQIEFMKRKRIDWKVKIHDALIKGREKLSTYYQKTCTTLGSVYATATILAPEYKLAFFETEGWEEDGRRDKWVSYTVALIVALANLSSRLNIADISRALLKSIPLRLLGFHHYYSSHLHCPLVLL